MVVLLKGACAVNETRRWVLRCCGNRREEQQQQCDASEDYRCVCVYTVWHTAFSTLWSFIFTKVAQSFRKFSTVFRRHALIWMCAEIKKYFINIWATDLHAAFFNWNIWTVMNKMCAVSTASLYPPGWSWCLLEYHFAWQHHQLWAHDTRHRTPLSHKGQPNWLSFIGFRFEFIQWIYKWWKFECFIQVFVCSALYRVRSGDHRLWLILKY